MNAQHSNEVKRLKEEAIWQVKEEKKNSAALHKTHAMRMMALEVEAAEHEKWMEKVAAE